MDLDDFHFFVKTSGESLGSASPINMTRCLTPLMLSISVLPTNTHESLQAMGTLP